MAEEIIGAAKPMSQGGKNTDGDVRILSQKGTEIRPGQHGETRIAFGRGVGRAGVAVEQRHFAEEFAIGQFGESGIMAVRIFHADLDAAVFDEVHRIPGIATLEESRSRWNVAHREKIAEFPRGLFVESAEQRDRTQGLEFH
jgi:hypothetical protein